MKLQSLFFTIAVCFLACIGPAQAKKMLADTRGDSALLTQDVGNFKKAEEPLTALFNTANSSLNGTYLWAEHPVKFGIDVGGKATNGALSLSGSEENAGEFTGNVFVSFPLGGGEEETDEAHPAKQRMMVELGVCRGTYPLVESAKTSTKTSTFPSMFLYYNRCIRKNLLAGASVGYVRQNNYAALDTRQIVESKSAAQTESENSSDMETNVILNQFTAREGDYEEFDALQVNADVLFTPDIKPHKIGLNLFLRYTYRHNRGSLFEPGFGIFNLKESAPAEKKPVDKTEEAAEAGQKACAAPKKQQKTKSGDMEEDTGDRTATGQAGNKIAPPDSPKNLSLLETGYSPWKIVYGFVGQWNADLDEFRFGVVAGYNF